MGYRKLEPDRIVETSRRLSQRISERFPDSGLSRVCIELLGVAEKAAITSEWIARPNLWLRAAVLLCALAIVGGVAGTVFQVRTSPGFRNLLELLQGLESAINDVVFVGVAVVFLLTWENRIKRNRALKALHELRSLAHVIDMHQLTKDPERVISRSGNTASSPERKMSGFALARYLDYCSEMLSIISKIAAVYVQHFDDAVTIAAVNEVETLTNGLARKIWQKIMLLDRITSEGRET